MSEDLITRHRGSLKSKELLTWEPCRTDNPIEGREGLEVAVVGTDGRLGETSLPCTHMHLRVS